MQVFYSSSEASHHLKKANAIALGNFDGLHLAHQTLLQTCVQKASLLHLNSMVYSFLPHPAQVLKPDLASKMIDSPQQKIEKIKNQKIDFLILEKFDLNFAQYSAEFFLEEILFKRLQAKAILCGYNFSFGHGRSGNIDLLKKFCQRNEIDFFCLEQQKDVNDRISSQRIRDLIQEQNLKLANKLMGQAFALSGEVEAGDQLGRTWGFPTLNLKTHPQQLIPKNGSYITQTQIEEEIFPSVTNIGFRPTLSQSKPELRIETHLLNQNLKKNPLFIKVLFYEKIRDEKKFNDLEELQKAIRNDCLLAEKYFMRAKS